MAEGRGEGNGSIPRGQAEGFNEMISIKHFDLPEAMCCSSRSGTEAWGDNVSKQRRQAEGKLHRMEGRALLLNNSLHQHCAQNHL